MRSGIVFLISFCLLSTTCIQQRQKLETKECSTTQADTSFIVVDSTLLLYLKKNTSDKEIYAVLEERPEYPGGMDEVVKYIQTHIQYPPAAIWKSHSTLTLLATQNYPFLLKYDCPLWLK